MRVHISRTMATMIVAPMLAAFPAALFLQAPAQAAGCGIFANRPYAIASTDEVAGNGGRSNCTSSTNVRVQLKWERPLQPDPVIAQSSGTYKNVTLNPTTDCRAGSQTYFTKTIVSSGDLDGDRRTIRGVNC
ncbi:hypothetical protein GCM10027215_33660 [Nocardioides zeae]